VSTALSGEESRARVQDLRHEHDAILVGSNTAVVDDPGLTDRSGKPRRRPLVRVVLDRRLRVHEGLQVIRSANEIPTLVFTKTENLVRTESMRKYGAEVIGTEEGEDYIPSVLAELKKREIQSVLVEGGTAVAGAFCDARLVDKITFIAAPIIIGGDDAPPAIGGRGAESLAGAMHLSNLEVRALGRDVELTGYPKAA
jgi:diaminohydroxyphosphoribosylaminopyrimidine deaminase/5-amino-6-(5-phosphoribosylamino)uracil reductase